MTDPHASSPPPLPAAPTSSFRAGGCLKYALIGCGGAMVLFILAVVVMMVWLDRNQGELGSAAASSVQEGARFGLETDDAGCFAEAQRRAGDTPNVAAALKTNGFLTSCLEYSRPTAGFCADVPAPTELRRSIAWQQERCKGQGGGCTMAISVVHGYCTSGQTKRTAADTLQWGAGADTLPDSVAAAAEQDSSGY
jgi:hypothetical protein